MTQELTLSDKLHFYLPHRLIYKAFYKAKDEATGHCEIVDFKDRELVGVDEGVPIVKGGVLKSSVIPYFRPLSSLTKEIVVSDYNDGKPFVPMHHLFLIAKGVFTDQVIPDNERHSSTEIKYKYPYIHMIFGYHFNSENDVRIPESIGFHMNMLELTDKFEVSESGLNQSKELRDFNFVPIGNEFVLFSLLYQWHFFLWDFEAYEKAGLIIKIED